MLFRKEANLRPLKMTSVRIARINAAMTDQTPATAPNVVFPHSGCARKGASLEGNSSREKKRLQQIMTAIGRKATKMGGLSLAGATSSISAGSNVEAVVACARIFSSSWEINDDSRYPS